MVREVVCARTCLCVSLRARACVHVCVCVRCQHYLQQMKMKIQCLEGFEPERAGYRYQKKQTLGKQNSEKFQLANCLCSLATR